MVSYFQGLPLIFLKDFLFDAKEVSMIICSSNEKLQESGSLRVFLSTKINKMCHKTRGLPFFCKHFQTVHDVDFPNLLYKEHVTCP